MATCCCCCSCGVCASCFRCCDGRDSHNLPALARFDGEAGAVGAGKDSDTSSVGPLDAAAFEAVVRSPTNLSKWTALAWLAYNDLVGKEEASLGHPQLPTGAAADAVGGLKGVQARIAKDTAGAALVGAAETSAWGTDAELFVAFHAELGVGVVAFRGTDHYTDIFTNAQLGMKPYVAVPGVPQGRVDSTMGQAHGGFVRHFGALSGLLSDALAASPDIQPDTPLVFLGHSLGGSVACIAAVNALVASPGRLVGLVTVGAPRTGDAAFASFLGGSSGIPQVHFQNQRDIVLSSLTPATGFQHAQGKHVTTVRFSTGDAMPTVTHGEGAEAWTGAECHVCCTFVPALILPCCVTWPVHHHQVAMYHSASESVEGSFSGPTTAMPWSTTKVTLLGGEAPAAGAAGASAAVSPAGGSPVDDTSGEGKD